MKMFVCLLKQASLLAIISKFGGGGLTIAFYSYLLLIAIFCGRTIVRGARWKSTQKATTSVGKAYFISFANCFRMCGIQKGIQTLRPFFNSRSIPQYDLTTHNSAGPNWENIPNDHKLYQTAKNYTNWPLTTYSNCH
jgi:hypothetical protein